MAISRRRVLGVVPALLSQACRGTRGSNGPSIVFARIPQADPVGSASNDIIEGRVTGASPGEKIVLYAKTGRWWVQPLVDQPITELRPNFTWTNATHLGTQYAALLVKDGYRPQSVLDSLPQTDDNILAVTVVPGADRPPSPVVTFSGYSWRLRTAPSARGSQNVYSPSNVSIDEKGAMRMRISKTVNGWSCAEASLTRNLGYGTYEFVVRGLETLEPAAVFGMFTFDYASGAQHNREMDIEISHWGNPTEAKNAQYVLQPYYVAANVHRFVAPAGTLTFSLHWEQNRATFRTLRGSVVASEHVFAAGVPSPGIESIRVVLYAFNGVVKLQHPMEVVVEQFTYFP